MVVVWLPFTASRKVVCELYVFVPEGASVPREVQGPAMDAAVA